MGSRLALTALLFAVHEAAFDPRARRQNGRRIWECADARERRLRLIPCYAWANRGETAMRVRLPNAAQG
jgi:DUF1680 family protein